MSFDNIKLTVSKKKLASVFLGVLVFTRVVAGIANAQGGLVVTGHYQYNVAPLAEPVSSPISMTSGKLADGDTSALASWPGNGTGPVVPTMVYDLQREVPLHAVKIHSLFPNKYWGVSSITVEARSSSEELYRVVGQINEPGNSWTNLTITADGSLARYVRIKLKRAHTYIYIGVSEIRIYAGSSSLPLQSVANLAPEFARETEELAKAGNYRYQHSPSREVAGVQIPISTGMLGDGDKYLLTSWAGNGSGQNVNPVVMDLRRDVPIQRVAIHTRFPNEYWGISAIEVQVRGSLDALYQTVGVINQPGSSWTHLSFPLDGVVARYVRVRLHRKHNYVYMGVSEINVFTSPSPLKFEAAVDLGGEFVRGTEELVTTGSYRYKSAPIQEAIVGSDIPVSTGKLMNGSEGLLTWPVPVDGAGTFPVVVDLRREISLQRLIVYSSQFANVHSIKVETRTSGDALYKTVTVVKNLDPLLSQAVIPLNGKSARYVRLTIRRKDSLLSVSFAEFQLFATPSSLPLQPVTNLDVEFSRDSEEPITSGYYRYLTAPGQEPQANTEISVGSGKLTDGNPEMMSWLGGQNASFTLPIVFDLKRDIPVQRIKIATSIPNEYWELQSIKVETRTSAASAYGNPITLYPAAGNWQALEIDVLGVSARYVRITFARSNKWLNIGVGDIQVITKASELALGGFGTGSVSLAAEMGRDTLLVDKYGQFLWSSWAGKVSVDSKFISDKDVENAGLPSVMPAGMDVYGGRLGQAYEATGYFRLTKIDGRWWFITPLGHKFYLNGLCDTNPYAWNYATSLNAKDNVTQRGVFQELPPEQEYAFAYDKQSGYPRLNFVVANLRRKFGTSFMAAWGSFMQRRMWQWGFNATGKWERAPADTLNVPFIASLRPADGVARINWAADPFDAGFAAKVEQGIKYSLETNARNPWMIGFTFESEAGWDLNIISDVLKLGAQREAKIQLVNYLFSKRTPAELTNAFGFTITETAHLLNASTSLPASLNNVGLAFIKDVAGPKYWSTVKAVARRLDSNHLFLGSALVPDWRSCFEWESSAVPYVDAISLDVYGKGTSWYHEKGYAALDKPVLVLEHGLVTTSNGRPVYAGATCNTHAERGAYYRHVVENLASYSNFVGASYFSLYDQPLTGRDHGGGGENFDFGLLNQQDQPYGDMIKEVKKTAFPRLYEIHEGLSVPYSAGY